MNQSTWLAQRAFLALVLMIGFYVLALAVAAVLLWIPYAEWTYVHRLDLRLVLVCVGAAGAILWAIVPRADRFTDPGPRLEESSYPRLFDLIRGVASATNQAQPADVYLLNDVNAWVAHRGGVMGLGSRRVMGLGLPLLQHLTVPELRAVLAHEFGHYSSGDVRLGPWIYKTRAAIARTLIGLGNSAIVGVFTWYWRMFLRLTQGVSRRQEFIADELAARVTSGAALASALRKTAGLAVVYPSYLRNEMTPALQAGCLPPMARGFDEYIKAESIASAFAEAVKAAEAQTETDAADSHPLLRDRLLALDVPKDSSLGSRAEAPASALIGDVEANARTLLEFTAGPEAVAKLSPIGWEEVGARVYATSWRKTVEHFSKALAKVRAEAIPGGAVAFANFGSRLGGPQEQNVSPEERVGRAIYVLAVAIAVALLDDSWAVDTALGKPLLLTRGERQFDPFDAMRKRAEWKVSDDDWRATCEGLGIAGRPLGAAVLVTS